MKWLTVAAQLKRGDKLQGRHTWHDIPELIKSKPGRSSLKKMVRHKIWPLARPAGSAYRRLVVNKTKLIAVTGSFGKTTTTNTIAQALGCPFFDHFNHTTILAFNLFRLPRSADLAVMEVGAGAGAQRTIAQARMLRPQIAVVTALGSEHNSSYPDIEQLRDAKAELLRVLPSDGLAVLNGDDPHVRWMAGETRARVVTYGFEEHNQVRASGYRLDWPGKSRFTVHWGTQSHEVELNLIGRPMVYPALAAIAIGLHSGFAIDQLLENLKGASPVPGRMHPVKLAGGAWLIGDDFKSPLETIEASLDLLGEIPAKRKFLVMGSISEVQGKVRPQYQRLGERAGALASRILFLGHSYKHFRSGLNRTGFDQSKLTYCRDGVRQALDILRQELGPGDVVLLKGRTSQRLSRIGLGLMGKKVRCGLEDCYALYLYCHDCPHLEKGWKGGQPAT